MSGFQAIFSVVEPLVQEHLKDRAGDSVWDLTSQHPGQPRQTVASYCIATFKFKQSRPREQRQLNSQRSYNVTLNCHLAKEIIRFGLW